MKKTLCFLLATLTLLLCVGCTNDGSLGAEQSFEATTAKPVRQPDIWSWCLNETEYQAFSALPPGLPSWDAVSPFLTEGYRSHVTFRTEKRDHDSRKYALEFCVYEEEASARTEPVAYQGVLGKSIWVPTPEWWEDYVIAIEYYQTELTFEEYTKLSELTKVPLLVPFEAEDAPETLPFTWGELQGYWIHHSEDEKIFADKRGNYCPINERVTVFYPIDIDNPGSYAGRMIIFFDLDGCAFAISLVTPKATEHPLIKDLTTRSTAPKTAEELCEIFESSLK